MIWLSKEEKTFGRRHIIWKVLSTNLRVMRHIIKKRLVGGWGSMFQLHDADAGWIKYPRMA